MEISKFEGDLFWNDDDPETNCEPEEEMDNYRESVVVTFQQAKSLPNFYGVRIWEPEMKEYQDRFFTTREEADELLYL